MKGTRHYNNAAVDNEVPLYNYAIDAFQCKWVRYGISCPRGGSGRRLDLVIFYTALCGGMLRVHVCEKISK